MITLLLLYIGVAVSRTLPSFSVQVIKFALITLLITLKKKSVLHEADPAIQDSCQPFFTTGLDRLDIFNPINKWVVSPYLLLDHPFGSNPTW